MNLQNWLKQNGKTQKWLAEQLDVSETAISLRFKRQREQGRQLPTRWIPKVLSITNGEVGIHDEWPVSASGGGNADREAV